MSGVRTLFGRGLDQDWVDSANGFWSVLLLSACSLGAFFMRYITDPISCFTPSTFTNPHVMYAKSACFSEELYGIPQNISYSSNTGPSTSYHLWVPLILFVQALCFKLPNIIWNVVKPSVTLNIDATVASLEYAQVANVETRSVVVKHAASVFGSLLRRNRFVLGMLYLLVKLLYCFNLLGQFLFLTIFFRQFLALEASEYVGFDITSYLRPLLHRTILCDFVVQSRENQLEFSVECKLPIAEIYEKLFVFLWYWVFLLAVVSVFNLLLWAGFLFLPFLRDSRISAYINASPGSYYDSSAITRFISGFLGIDGVLMLSMISRNSSEMVAADLSQHLYQVFLEKGDQFQATPTGKTVDVSAGNDDVHEVKVVTPDEDVAMETLSSPAADTSATNLLDQDGTGEHNA